MEAAVRMISYQIPPPARRSGLPTDFIETENLPRKLPSASSPELNML